MLLPGQGRWAEVLVRGTDEVLKLYREGHPREEVEREATNARTVLAAGVLTPRVVDVVSVGRRVGIVFERVEGPTVLGALSARPGDAAALARAFAALHADVHACEASGLPAQRAAVREDIARAADVPRGMKDAALAALESLPDGHAVCHGDFHPLNVILTAVGPTVLDWYKATSGNADADLARTLMLLRLTPLPCSTGEDARRSVEHVRRAFYSAYCRHYAELRPFMPEQVLSWMVPVAVARLARDVSPEERRQLLALVEALRAGGGAEIFELR